MRATMTKVFRQCGVQLSHLEIWRPKLRVWICRGRVFFIYLKGTMLFQKSVFSKLVGSLMQFGLSPVNLGPSFTSNWTRTRAYCRTFAPHCRWQRSIFSARLVCVCLNSGGNFNTIIESKFVQSVWWLHLLFYFI